MCHHAEGSADTVLSPGKSSYCGGCGTKTLSSWWMCCTMRRNRRYILWGWGGGGAWAMTPTCLFPVILKLAGVTPEPEWESGVWREDAFRPQSGYWGVSHGRHSPASGIWASPAGVRGMSLEEHWSVLGLCPLLRGTALSLQDVWPWRSPAPRSRYSETPVLPQKGSDAVTSTQFLSLHISSLPLVDTQLGLGGFGLTVGCPYQSCGLAPAASLPLA